MIIDMRIGSVANWWFEDRRSPVQPTTRSELYQLLKSCHSAAEILEAHQLLRPSKVVFSGWRSDNSKTDTLVQVEQSDLTISLPKESNVQSLLTYCEQTIVRLDSFLCPTDIKILGSGIIFDANNQECSLPNVIWIRGMNLVGARIVDIGTQSDAWLPYTLQGEPQTEVWMRNSGRLQTALQEIQECLGVVPCADDHTDFAMIQDFVLTNLTDIDGEVIPYDFEKWGGVENIY